MAKTYYLDVSAATHTFGGAFSHLLAATLPTSNSDTITATNGGGTNSGYYEEAEDTGVTRTSTGTFSQEVNVTAAASNTTMAVQWHRVNSGGTIQASSGYTGEQSTASTGLKTFSTSSSGLGTWSSTDRLVVELRVTNNNAHGGAQGPTFDTGTTNAEGVTPFTSALSATLNQATETDSAQALTPSKARAIAQATETDSAQPVSSSKGVTLNQALETDSAQPVSSSKTVTLNQALEADSALIMTPGSAGLSGDMLQALETDSALSFAAVKTVTLGQALEADIAQPVSSSKARALGQALEADVSFSFTPSKAFLIGQALETDIAQPMGGGLVGGGTIGQALEVDVAQPMSSSKARAIGQALEADSALGLSRVYLVPLNQALEVDVAQPMSSSKARAIGQALEVDVALAFSFVGGSIPYPSNQWFQVPAPVTMNAGGRVVHTVPPRITH